MGNFGGKGRTTVKYMDAVMSCAKTAEPIEMLLGIQRRVDPRNHVLDVSADATTGRIINWVKG